MPSQIKVDEIKNVAGQHEIKTNTFKGQTTAGSIAVQGEGTNTTNLQQGLAKAWLNYKGTSTNAINDSFNTATVTDNNTGDYTQNLTTSFSSANNSYTLSTQAEPGNEDNGMYTYLQTFATGTFRFGARTARNSSKTDVNYIFPKIHGDLA